MPSSSLSGTTEAEFAPEPVEALDSVGADPPELDAPCPPEPFPSPPAATPPPPLEPEPLEVAGATPDPASDPELPLPTEFGLSTGFSPPAVGTCSVYWSTTEGAPDAVAVPPAKRSERLIVRMAVSL